MFDPYINKDSISEIDTKYHKLFKYNLSNIKDFDIVIIAVKHDQFCRLTSRELKKIIKNKQSIIYDIKNCLNKENSKLCEYHSI
jgi:UDP-N-acetyl-D-mannosaminuronate dehydrogenase